MATDAEELLTEGAAQQQDVLTHLLRQEWHVCRDLLEATHSCREGLQAQDLDAVTSALRERARGLTQLDNLEQQVTRLRRMGVPIAPMASNELSSLRRLTQELREAESAAQAAAADSLAEMRTGLRQLQQGSQTLRSYAGSRTQTPRFTDQKG